MKKKIITNQQGLVILIVPIMLNIKIMQIEKKHCQFKNISIKVGHTYKISLIISKNLIYGKYN